MIDTKTRFYIANLGKYNEGYLVGDWLTFPFSEKEYNDLMVRIRCGSYSMNHVYHCGFVEDGNVYEETAIHDTESSLDIEVGECDDIDAWNDLISEIESFTEDEYEALKALIESEGGSCHNVEEHVRRVRAGDVHFYPNCTLEELAESLADEGEFDKEFLLMHIDWEGVARDLSFDGYTETAGGVLVT